MGSLPQHKNKLPMKISAELIAFADCVNPSQSYIKEGKEKVQTVFSTLQRMPNLSISRSFIGGSVGKSTAVIYPDFDCVVFVNKQTVPLTGMVDEFEKILREKANPLSIVVNSLSKTRITVSLEYTNGVEMDLLPAISFSQDPNVQYKEVLQRISANPSLHLGYSSSLAETQIQFMKNQSGGAHQLVRIAKYWYKLCTVDDNVYGGSSIIEILCVDVVLDLDPQGGGVSFQMLQAFKNFLKKVAIIKTLKIAFYRKNDGWVRVLPNEFTLPIYKKHFHADILSRQNFIIEPANPYNDLAKNINNGVGKRLKDFADKMLARLEKLENSETNEMKTLSPDGRSVELVHYDKLFEPFIMTLKTYYPQSALPKNICIDYYYQNYNTGQVNADVRREDFFKQNKNEKCVWKTIENNLLFLIRGKACRTAGKPLTFINGVPDITKVDEIKAAVKSFLTANFVGNNLITESSCNKDHQDSHVTLNIPYRRTGNIYAVRFSMKW